jgi:hypothetical protein
LVAAAAILGIPCDAAQSWHVHGKTDGPFEELDILRVAKRLGLKARAVQLSNPNYSPWAGY